MDAAINLSLYKDYVSLTAEQLSAHYIACGATVRNEEYGF